MCGFASRLVEDITFLRRMVVAAVLSIIAGQAILALTVEVAQAACV